MAVPFSNTKLRVPKGFQNILECLAREVLRSQPDNIHEFAAAYFEKMLKVRTETGHDPAVHGAKLEDRNYNNEIFKKRSVDPHDPQQQQAAVTIQSQYRQHSAKSEVKAMREEDAATRIQAGFRGFIDREQVRSMKGDDDAPEQEKGPAEEEQEVDIDLNDPEVEKAAIKIQAGFKGFKARKDVSGSNEDQAEKPSRPASAKSDKQLKKQEEEVDINLADPDVAQAALRIQAGFRGHQARQEVLAQKMTLSSEFPKHPMPSKSPSGDLQEPPPPSPPPPSTKTQEEQDQEDIAAIDLGDPELKAAALKIQAGFKGIKSRKKLHEKKAEREAQKAAPAQPEKASEVEEVDIDLNDPDVEKAAVKIQAGFKGLKTRKGLKQKTEEETPPTAEEAAPPAADTTVPKEEEVDIDLEDPATEKAALKIQASFRGFQTRRDMGEKKQEGAQESSSTEAPSATQAQEEGEKPAAEEGEAKKEQEEEMDIDLEDPEVEKAALKIQAGFKGLKARKELQDKKPGGETDTVDGAPAEETSAADEGSKVEGEGQEEVKASEEETQPKVVEGQGDSQQQEGEEQQPPAEAAAAEGEQAAGEVKGDE